MRKLFTIIALVTLYGCTVYDGEFRWKKTDNAGK